MNKADLKKKVCSVIDEKSREIIEIGETISKNPELGYKEFETSRLVAEKFESLGLSVQEGLAVTGLKAKSSNQIKGPTVAILGELDSVVCFDHPRCNPETGAAHACGHNAQIAGMLGTALGLVESGAVEDLGGGLVWMAVPAEEYVEIEYRLQLRDEGKIEFLGGKQELIKIGAFDDVDIAMMFHTRRLEPPHKVMLKGTNNGFIAKAVKYTGKEAHAGGAPHEGINALNAAILGIMGIHAQRETFQDKDHIRVHPIITRGGDLVNVIPAHVSMETYVRGASIDAILAANKKVNRALQAGAMAIGAEVETTEIPGYLPYQGDVDLEKIFSENAAQLIGVQSVGTGKHSSGSTDMGDVSHIIPSLHPYIGGTEGRGHSRDYIITNQRLAYIESAKMLAMTAVDLLWDQGRVATEICSKFEPKISKKEYAEFWRNVVSQETTEE